MDRLMDTRDVVGRRIVKVRQNRIYDYGSDQTVMVLDALVLDNGTAVLLIPTNYNDRDGFPQDAVIVTKGSR